jgi:uncharacterized protein DUF2840
VRYEDGDPGAHREHDRAIRSHSSVRPAGAIGSTTSNPDKGKGNGMSELTHVELTWLKKRIENWIRFGRTVEEHVVDRQHRVVSFAADSIFAFVRWVSNDYGTIVSRIDILRAVQQGERYSTVPFVRPGGESLLHLSGWPKVEKVLQAIDGVETLGIDPADAAPEHWRHIHNRLFAGELPRPYTHDRHQAWLHRRKLCS